MDYLLPFLERGDVRSFIQQCRESRAVQGVIVEIDPLWLAAWRFFERHHNLDPAFPAASRLSLFEEVADPPYFYLTWENWISESNTRDPINPLDYKQLGVLPRWWKRVRSPDYLKDPLPIHLRVCLYPRARGAAGNDQPPASIPNLSEYALNYRFEPRPVPQLAVSSSTRLVPLVGGGSIGVGAGGPGTLGGIIRDGNGNFYGVTCAHVASPQAAVVDHPAQADANTQNAVGEVAYCQIPAAYPHQLPIMPVHQAVNANEVDVALIQLDPKIAARHEINMLGPVRSIYPAGSIQQWQSTTFTGRTSSLRNVEFRGLIAYYNIPNASNTGTICFENLYEIQWPPPASSNAGPPIQAGDSGAWLCISGVNGYEWAGMAVAWDPTMGFALTASSIETWWKQQGLSFQLT